MSKIILTVLIGISMNSYAGIGFRNGNTMDAHYVSGRIHIDCSSSVSGGPTSGGADCRADILNPSEADYFVGPSGVVADSVELTAIHADNSSRTKKDSYSATKGQSSGRFNLWISTVFQRPLLDEGLNKVHYILRQDGNVVSEGDFEANVMRSKDLRCKRTGFYYSNSSSDCINGYNFCPQYFYENNYCQ